MIAKLSGILDSTALDSLIIDVQGVGYQVFCSIKTLHQCGQYGDPLSLFIETHVREDHIHLFGFLDQQEQLWFKHLISVQGVGAKAALAVLSVCEPDQLSLAIAAQDKAIITRADGVGPKIASRIISELKDKVSAFETQIKATSSHAQTKTTQNMNANDGKISHHLDHDVVSALVNLGYGRSEAYNAMLQAKTKANNDNDTDSLESYIKLALQELSA